MSLRSKILLVFCVVALVPALITASLDTQRLRRLSADLTQHNATELAAQALATMERIAIGYADLLDLETRRIRTIVELQAEYAERLLNTAEAPGQTPYFEDSFDRNDPALELTKRAEPPRNTSGRAIKALPVSWTHQVFHYPSSVTRSDVEQSAEALTGMIQLYRKVRQPDDYFIRAQYVVLENGLSASYPGHGNYPQSYDGRERPWYPEQRHLPRFRWYRPHTDAASGALVINGTLPLFSSAGDFIGITGVDIDLGATFSALELPENLREGSELMQIIALRPPQVREAQLLLVARQHSNSGNNHWQTLPELEWVTFADQKTTDDLREAMLAGRSGNLRASVNGREHFVLYQKFGREATYVVMVVPVETATRAALEMDRYARRATADHISTLIKFLIAASTLVVIVALVSSRHLTRPIDQLKRAVERLSAGDFSVRAVASTNDELKTLSDAFNNMVPQLENHARVHESLALAREIQQQLLPTEPPLIPGYDVAGVSMYSEQTGGDYFDYISLDSNNTNRFGVVVADVAGHGIASSILMATTRALLHGGSGRGLTLGELLSFVNQKLADDVTRGHFVTLFMLGLNAANGRIEWSSAGHEAALRYVASRGTVEELGASDIPLAIDSDWVYETNDGVELECGDIVVLITDGVSEAIAENGERFGQQRLRSFIADNARLCARDLSHGLRQALDEFRGSVPQRDDVTIVVIKRVCDGVNNA